MGNLLRASVLLYNLNTYFFLTEIEFLWSTMVLTKSRQFTETLQGVEELKRTEISAFYMFLFPGLKRDQRHLLYCGIYLCIFWLV